MKNKLTIVFPRGCGGSWLSNMIWHVENNNFTHPLVDIVYDNEPRSKSIRLSHSFDVIDGEIRFCDPDDNFILFSTPYLFNMYINDTFKVRYSILNLGNATLRDQLFTLSDSFRYVCTDESWHNCYCQDNDLEYSDVFQNPSRFVESLFAILDANNVKFAANTNYVLESIKHYRSTCVDPESIFGNLDNLAWLAACHAVSMLKEIPLPITITEDTKFSEIREVMSEFDDITKEFVYPMMFKWD